MNISDYITSSENVIIKELSKTKPVQSIYTQHATTQSSFQ